MTTALLDRLDPLLRDHRSRQREFALQEPVLTAPRPAPSFARPCLPRGEGPARRRPANQISRRRVAMGRRAPTDPAAARPPRGVRRDLPRAGSPPAPVIGASARAQDPPVDDGNKLLHWVVPSCSAVDARPKTFDLVSSQAAALDRPRQDDVGRLIERRAHPSVVDLDRVLSPRGEKPRRHEGRMRLADSRTDQWFPVFSASPERRYLVADLGRDPELRRHVLARDRSIIHGHR